MASIAEWIQRIKTAIYGEEVRGAIWQSLQAMNDELTSADVTQIPVNKADIATLRTDMTAVQGSVTSLQGDVETAGAEVEDIRVGADGTVYGNAGTAVREQVGDLKNVLRLFASGDLYGLTTWQRGQLYHGVNSSTQQYRVSSNKIVSVPFDIHLTADTGFRFSINFFENDTWTSGSDWQTDYTIEKNTQFKIMIARSVENTDETADIETFVSKLIFISVNDLCDDVSSLNDDVSALNDDVSALNDDVSALNDALIKRTTVTLVDNVETVGSGPMADTRRWFLPKVIPANSRIDVIKYRTASKISGTVDFEIWKKTGATLTRDKIVSSTPSASSTIEVAIDYTTTQDAMFSIRPTGGTSIRQQSNTTYNMWASTDLESTILDYGDLDKQISTTYTPCLQLSYVQYSEKEFFDLPDTVVTIGEGMDYEEIQDALLAITDDSARKPYTLLVMPKGTPYEPFSMLRDTWTNNYPWNSITPRYISIIGVNKANCIIRSDSGNYKLPCGEPLTNGIIKNLTFIMTNDDQDPNATQGGYCLHIDCRTLNDVGYNMVIEDCDFEDASGPCLGIGMHKNCTLTIRRCNFKTTLNESYAPHEGYTNLYNYGVIFCHSSTRADATNQFIKIEDCFGTCAEGDKSLWLSVAGDYDPSTASFYYQLLRNVFWNETQNAPSYSISNRLTPNPANFGNNNISTN